MHDQILRIIESTESSAEFFGKDSLKWDLVKEIAASVEHLASTDSAFWFDADGAEYGVGRAGGSIMNYLGEPVTPEFVQRNRELVLVLRAAAELVSKPYCVSRSQLDG